MACSARRARARSKRVVRGARARSKRTVRGARRACAQVYALSKERDALKRGNEMLGDYGNQLREKDDIIKQVGCGVGCV